LLELLLLPLFVHLCPSGSTNKRLMENKKPPLLLARSVDTSHGHCITREGADVVITYHSDREAREETLRQEDAGRKALLSR